MRIELVPAATAAFFAMAALVAIVALSGVQDDTANAAYPPALNGKIVFERVGENATDIWVMDADGSNPTNLTTDQDSNAYYPRWSPDGTKIAYEYEASHNDADVYVMNADGSNKTPVGATTGYEGGPTWSPDGTKIIFLDGEDVWVMNVDGTNKVRLTDDPAFDCCGEWSPDGSRIVFDSERSGARVQWIMEADGGNQTMVPGSIDGDLGYRFSPDGQQYVFYNGDDGDIYTMNVDGSGRQNITNNPQDFEHAPIFTADGTKILYAQATDESTSHIIMANPDGSSPVELTSGDTNDAEPDQQRVAPNCPSPVTAAPGATCPPVCPGIHAAGEIGARSTCQPTPSPTGTPSTGSLLWGDSDCSGTIATRDNQALLRKVLSQVALSQTEPCPDIGASVTVGDTQYIWGDWDCSGDVTTRDNQALLRKVLSQAALSQTEPCPDIGEEVAA